jgi:hypothetical protein
VPAPQVVFRLSDPRIDEASGIGLGIRSPGVLYVQNDSGDSARFFALDATTGRLLTVYDVPGATNVDWEDLAVAKDSRGVPSVWLGDIGDNDAKRSEIDIYRVDEPAVDRSASGSTRTTTTPQIWRLRYPSGPSNAESLAVAPGGAAYIVTKSVFGQSRVYAVPPKPDPNGVQTLKQIGGISFSITGSPDPFAPIGELTATGAALSRDGSLLVVRTYADAYLWRVANSNVAAALRTPTERIALPLQPQGEGVTFDGPSLLTDSEKAGSAVYSVPLPAALTVPVAPRTTPAESRVRSAGRSSSSGASAGSQRSAFGGTAARAGFVAGAVLLMVALWAGLSRRRAARPRG